MYYSKRFLVVIFYMFFLCCQNEQITYYNGVKKIIDNKCASCHHLNGAGPFELVEYSQIKKRTSMILEVINSNYMPPWPADTEYRDFIGDKSLTHDEKKIINKWIKNGAKKGDENEYQEHVKGIPINEIPDLVVKMDSFFLTKGNNQDQFMMMKFPFELNEKKYIKRIEFVPGNIKIVHHVNAHLINYEKNKNIFNGKSHVDTEILSDIDAFEALDLLNDDGTYPILTPSVSNYLPGSSAVKYPEGIGVFHASEKNVILVNDFHYAPTPYPEQDSSYFKIFFSDSPPKRRVKETQLGTFGISEIVPKLVIPPNEIKSFTTKARITKDISLLTINPHMHLLGKTFLAYAVTLQGDTIPLIKIDDWNFRWQYFYTFKKMLKIPAGSEIVVEASYDNTTNNKDNPFNPPQLITERINKNGKGSMKTSDEMLQFIINYLDYVEGDENIELGG
tara:strand:+ start:670 stop:2013 length:1344 start_codon:yes stop_codon:yes gene_type:complete